ncbi:MAG: restriction endonuclease subunit S [Magnetococcales bacterium]|nr:restriction endonuclease subunit S [Magnetococcales bacterium]
MSANLIPYPQMRDSGLPWLGLVPEHWEVRRNGRLFAQRIDTGHEELPILEVSLRTGVRVRDMDNGARKQQMTDRSKYKRAAKGDIAYNMMRMWQGAVGVAPKDGLISPAYVVARPFPEVNPRYYSYLFRTADYMREVNKFSRGIVADRNRLYWDEFKQMPSAFPPTGEQIAIANFLDAHGRRTAHLIRNKRRLIALLNEQKQAIINKAVTRGLDPNAPMKPTGIDWMPEIPAHWEATLLKHVADVRFSGVDKHSHDHEIPVRLCNYTDVYKNDRIIGGMDLMLATATNGEISRFTLKGGDVIVTKDSETPDDIAVPALVSEDLPGVVCAYHLGLLRPDPEHLFGEFLFRSIGSARITEQFHVLATGVTRYALSKHDIKNAIIPLPPIDEQVDVCKWITDSCVPLDEAIQRSEDEIRLIREYRERLIADVVTGKLDVRDVAVNLREADDALEDLDEESADDLLEDETEPEEVEESP